MRKPRALTWWICLSSFHYAVRKSAQTGFDVKIFSRLIQLALLVAWSAFALVDSQPSRMARAGEDKEPAAVAADDEGEVPPPPGTPPGQPRKVSPEGVAYLEKLRKNTPFGTNDFDLEQLRAGMG